MFSDKIQKIAFKRGLDLSNYKSEKDVWDHVYRLDEQEKKPKPIISICFTGFTDLREAELEEMADKAGFGVNKNVVKSTTHLCAGNKPGPKKVEKAKAQRTKIIDENSFLEMIQTGEIL